MDKWTLVVGTNLAEPAKAAEFNDWYNTIHLPDILETEGFTGATRHEDPNAAEGQPRYLALYSIETDDIDAVMKANGANLAKKREAGRMMDGFSIVWRGLYKQIHAAKK